MASPPANGLTFYVSLPLEDKEYLGAVRHWDNLKTGVDEETLWLKDLTPVQIDGPEIKSLPRKTVFYSQGAQLFLNGSALPHQNVPQLLWTPIERGLPVRLPAFNHNYFGLKEKAAVGLQRSGEEKEPFALLTTLSDLQRYAGSAPAVRLQGLRWAVADGSRALILGVPLLPVRGDVFWRSDDFLFPAGYALVFPLLRPTLQRALNPQNDHWLVWNRDGTYWNVKKESLSPLSIASVRKTTEGSPAADNGAPARSAVQ